MFCEFLILGSGIAEADHIFHLLALVVAASIQVRDYKAVRKLLLTLLQAREATPVMVSPLPQQVWPM